MANPCHTNESVGEQSYADFGDNWTNGWGGSCDAT